MGIKGEVTKTLADEAYLNDAAERGVFSYDADGETVAEAFAAVAKDAKNENLTEMVKNTDLATWLKQ